MLFQVLPKVITLNKLSPQFYADYPFENYPELMSNDSRPYLVFVIEINNIKFAIPFRTNVRHKYCYKFRNTSRKTDSSTGIDFTKAIVVIDNDSYIGQETFVDDDEYLELSKRFFFIVNKFKSYLDGYYYYARNAFNNESIAKKYIHSTLKYFHRELGI